MCRGRGRGICPEFFNLVEVELQLNIEVFEIVPADEPEEPAAGPEMMQEPADEPEEPAEDPEVEDASDQDEVSEVEESDGSDVPELEEDPGDDPDVTEEEGMMVEILSNAQLILPTDQVLLMSHLMLNF